MKSPAVRLDEPSRLDDVRVLVVRDILTEDGAKVSAVDSAEEARGSTSMWKSPSVSRR